VSRGRADARPGDLVVGRWGARFLGRFVPCAVGRGGIGHKRAEGDGITPVGSHRIEAVLVRADRARRGQVVRGGLHPAPSDLGGGVQRRMIGPRDGWSDDPADPAYNRLVRRPHAGGHERLRRPDPLYDLVGVLDWNRAPAVPGRGSAVFLHVWRGPRQPTAGCIAFRRRDLEWILRHWAPRRRVVVRG
jgi:L,D-peptidoglycan transpeptidase YkuD (ErfK/YbiS/YcfS/YnhG family)